MYFFDTVAGKKFTEYTIPSLIEEMEKLNKTIEKENEKSSFIKVKNLRGDEFYINKIQIVSVSVLKNEVRLKMSNNAEYYGPLEILKEIGIYKEEI